MSADETSEGFNQDGSSASFPTREEKDEVQDLLDEAWPGSDTYTVTVDIEALAGERGQVDSEEVVGLYETVEEALEGSRVKKIFADSTYKTAGFRGPLERFEAAYEEAVKGLGFGDNAMEYIEVEEQEVDYQK